MKFKQYIEFYEENIFLKNALESSKTTDKDIGREGQLCHTSQLKKCSIAQEKTHLGLYSSKCLKSQNIISEKSEKKCMTEALKSFAKNLILSTNLVNHWSRLVHNYFQNRKDSEDTRKLFLDFSNHINLDDIEPLNGSPEEAWLFRVKLDKSIHRIILRGSIAFDFLYVDGITFYNYDDDIAYAEFLKKVDKDEIEFHEENIMESIHDWSGDWIRYTSQEDLTINKKPWHQDPAGIYFFPKEFKTSGSWHKTNKYIMSAKLKPGAKVLDLGKLSKAEQDKLYDDLGVKKREGPGFWGGLRMAYLGKQIKFANDLRKLGYDAIFDDTKEIHTAEVQLVVLNPVVVKVVSIERTEKGTDQIKKLEDKILKEFPGWKKSKEKFSTSQYSKSKTPILKFTLTKGDMAIDVKLTHSDMNTREYSPSHVYAELYSYSLKDSFENNKKIDVTFGSSFIDDDLEKYAKEVNAMTTIIEDEDHSIYTDKEGKHWGNQGAGGLFYCKDTDRYLIAHRSKYVNEPNTWGTWGGAIDKGESPEEALKREIGEEAGYEGKYTLKPIYTYTDNDFKFYNYLIIVPEEFEPKHSWETQGHKWASLSEIPKPMHYGLKELLKYLSKEEDIMICVNSIIESLSGIKITDDIPKNLEDRGIEVPIEHQPSANFEPAKEAGENHRLNDLDRVYYAIYKNKVIGHLGIEEQEDPTVRAVYVDKEYRGQGVGMKLYEYFLNSKKNETLYSDDAREPGDEAIWKKLMAKYPQRISYNKKLNQYVAQSVSKKIEESDSFFKKYIQFYYYHPDDDLNVLDNNLEEGMSEDKESQSGTLTLWHGGNLEMGLDNIAHKGGRWEHGPGLYLTTHYDTAKKYAKGSRKLYQIVIKKGSEINKKQLSIEDVNDFVTTWVIKSKRKDVLERIHNRVKEGKIDAQIFLNIMINEEAIKNTDTDKLRTFLVDNGVDYAVVDNAFGWHERMIVLFNMKNIVSKKIIGSKDKIDDFDLPTEFKENKQPNDDERKIFKAWEKLKNNIKFSIPNFSLFEVEKESGLSRERFRKALMNLARKGYIGFDEGTWSLSTQDERNAALDINGHRAMMMTFKKDLTEAVSQSAPVPPPGPQGMNQPPSPEKADQKKKQMGMKANNWLKNFGRVMPNVSRELQTGNMGQNASQFFTLLAQMPKQDWYRYYFKP